MSGFKLLAIRPLEDCNPKFLKVLTAGEIYQFYNDYTFIKQNKDFHSDVKEVKYKSSIPDDLYNIDGVNLNISAIVGENGSGKSSLMELLFVSVFLLAMQEDILKNHSKEGETIEESLGLKKAELEKLKSDLSKIYLNKNFIPIIKEQYTDYENDVRGKVYEKLNLDQRIKWKSDEINKLSKLIEEYALLKKHIKVEIFYQISNTIFKLKIDSKQDGNHSQIECVKTNIENKETDICENKRNLKIDNLLNNPYDLSSYFFYSLVLNYSQYALNSKEIGDWIIELFHKNDGYQTPIVINPMRNEGNFDINRENDLVKQRLLVNILTPLKKAEEIEDSLRHLAQNHIANYMKIELNLDKVDSTYPLSEKYDDEWTKVDEKFSISETSKIFKREKINDVDKIAKEYILQKMIDMTKTYEPYKPFTGFTEFDLFLSQLCEDFSHITNKLYQTINFLKYNYSKLFSDGNWQEIDNVTNKINECRLTANIKELKDWKNEGRKGEQPIRQELIQFIPPPIFNIDVSFNKEKSKNSEEAETNTLLNLSSGEKQYIYSISSIMYHLRYLDSVKVIEDKGELKYKYKYINLVFDEIELYYHPELQRQFINDFRNAVGRCNLKYIENINCTFITHSPFILSDIPRANILRLKKENEINIQFDETFGANVHDLLDNSFFMKSTTGEFSLKKIDALILFYHKVREYNDSDITEVRDEFERNKIQFEFLKNNIGEDVYREILGNHYSFIEDFFKDNTLENV